MLVRRPTDGLDVVYFGDQNGNIYQMEGDGTQDGPNTVTNLALYSAQMDNAVWVASQLTVTPNATAALDGTLTADKLTDTVVNDEHSLTETLTLSPNQILTLSVFASAVEYSRIRLRIGNSTMTSFVDAVFHLTGSGTVVSSGQLGNGSGVAADIVPYSLGFYRCILSGTPDTSGTQVQIQWELIDNSGNASFAGTGTSGIYVWGAQLQTGGSATTYVPTTSAAATYTAATNTSFRTSGELTSLWRGPKDQLGLTITDLKGYVRYRKGFQSTLTHTAQWEGMTFGDNSWVGTLPAFSDQSVFGGAVYFGGAYYFGTQYEGRAARQTWYIAGANFDRFGLKQTATGTQFEFPETGIQFQAEA